MKGLPKHTLTQNVVLAHMSQVRFGQLNWLCTLHIASQEAMYHLPSLLSRGDSMEALITWSKTVIIGRNIPVASYL